MIYNSQLFDLTNWKLAVPVDQKGGITGTALEIYNLTNYSSPYFYSGTNGAMVFKADVSGATSKGSSNARSELREMNGSKLAAWTLKEGGTMTATMTIDNVPVKFDGKAGKIVIGQIHGKDQELVRLFWENNTIYFKNDYAGAKNIETTYQLLDETGKKPNISLGETFSYKIDAHGDKLTVEVYADGHTYTSTSTVNEIWQSDTFYFKAGLYLGVNETTASGSGQVSIHDLDFGHIAGAGLGGLPDPVIVMPPVPEPSQDPQVPSTTMTGTNGNDVLTGSHAIDDVIHGGAGNDRISGRDGNDWLFGDDGNDSLYGYYDNDTLIGGNGDDYLYGSQGNDSLYGGDGKDTLYGEDNDDHLWGGWANDVLNGGNGNDYLDGGTGQDKLTGGAGHDVFVFSDMPLPGQHDIILDFNPIEDKLNIDALLQANGLVSVQTVGGKAGLYIDNDGAGGQEATLIATFEGNSIKPLVITPDLLD